MAQDSQSVVYSSDPSVNNLPGGLNEELQELAEERAVDQKLEQEFKQSEDYSQDEETKLDDAAQYEPNQNGVNGEDAGPERPKLHVAGNLGVVSSTSEVQELGDADDEQWHKGSLYE